MSAGLDLSLQVCRLPRQSAPEQLAVALGLLHCGVAGASADTGRRVVGGLLATEPSSAGVVSVFNTMKLEIGLRDAKIEGTPTRTGEVNGSNVRHVNGAVAVLGHTRDAMYQASKQLADGHPDREVGELTSDFFQRRITGIPALVVDQETSSVNASLSGKQERSNDY